ncbi:uncharacterized protein LOC122948713 [Acropora millepora]|uniref:uncharacterized protein LOC122948713 n=1 Tax=Acropora millepora TaxID=45264 RepID=UPI001CF1B764|nr:uncharacterized protein LOC122948713 [Acropora millepora]
MLHCLNCQMPFPMSEFQGHLENCCVAGPSQPSIRSGRIEQYLHTGSSSVQHVQQLIPDASAKDIEEALEAAKGDTNAAVNHLLNSQDQSGSAKGDIDARPHAIGTNSVPVTPLAYEIEDDDNDDQDLLLHSWMEDTSNAEFCKDHDFSTLPDILDVLEKKLTGPDMAVEVDQNAVVVKALTIYKDPKFDMTRPFKVSFNNQPALDVGGPKREFFFNSL